MPEFRYFSIYDNISVNWRSRKILEYISKFIKCYSTAQKMKFSIKDFCSKSEQIESCKRLQSVFIFNIFLRLSLQEKCLNLEFFVACLFLYSDSIPIFTLYIYIFSSNTRNIDQKPANLDTLA